MTKDEEVERIKAALGPLCEPLHDVFTWADQQRRERLPEFDGDPNYGWHGTHTIRAFAHYRLADTDTKLGSWTLAGNHARNGELWLSDGDYRTRLLHNLRNGEPPPAGTNATRRAWYSNTPLFDIAEPAPRLFGPPNDRLLFIWGIDAQTGVPIFRVVRPIGNWEYGDHAKTDLDFILPETAEDLAKLEFVPSDEDLDLVMPDREEGGPANAGGSAG